MSDGLFDSSSGGNFTYIDVSSGRDRGPDLPAWVLALIGLLILFFAFWYIASLAEERKLDHSTYIETSRANFDNWEAPRQDHIRPGTLWFEEGSSHRDNYHCKGGQFLTGEGATVTFCCSVEPSASPACMAL